MAYVVLCCRLLLGATFVASLATKLRSRATLHEFLAAAGALLRSDSPLVRLLAVTSIATELLIVITLLIPALVTAGFALTALLLLVYTLAIARALQHGVTTPCRCIGTSSDPLHSWLILRNAVLFTVSIVGIATSLAGSPAVGFTTALAVSVAIAIFGLALVMSFDDLVYLARRNPM